ncbi:MAG: 30S ribosomal protein S16 [Candidatus Moraniibacteriota bacterium]|nr:MAG: 30S ribosomal protein S16 [Candidatus Moranbacteria bacterium]
MLAIRLNRTGKRNRAYFRVVVQEHTKAPGKRHVEILGSYDPHKKTTILKKDRILYWIGQGAQVSDAVHNMLVRESIIEGKKVAKKMPRPVAKEEPVAEAAPAEEVKAEEAVVAEAPAEAPVAEVVAEAPKAEETPAEEPKA